VLRSSQTREESSATAGGQNGQVTVNNEMPGNQQQTAANAGKDQTNKSEEINNYEISRTTKTEVTEAGRVQRMSVAVLVDGTYTKNEKGDLVYAPRAKEDIERIATLVRSAIGFDKNRGDQVDVVNLKFADAPAAIPLPEPTGWLSVFQFTKDDVMYFIELGVMSLLAIVVVFMVVRPLVKRVLAEDPAPAVPVPALPEVEPAAVAGPVHTAATAQMIDVAQVQGQVHAQSVHRVGELADRNPNETVSIIRQWLTEPA